MLRSLLLLFLSVFAQIVRAQTYISPRGETFTRRIVADKLSDPWEITYGPDKFLWITEAKGYIVSRIDPATGVKRVLLDLTNERQFPRYDLVPDEQDGGKPWPQGGLMGMALHPRLLQDKPYVYLAYLYMYEGADKPGDGGRPNHGGYYFRTRLVRYEYNQTAQQLTKPLILCDTIPGSNDHNSGRLLIAPVNGKPYLFYTVGDLGAGQYANAGRPNHAQQVDVYEGKVLRFNLEPDASQTSSDQWIPDDNPFNTRRQNAVWSYGHRNAQGLTHARIGGQERLYASEHGPVGDDEINLIEKGKNYGHPLVIGYNDGNYNGLAAGVTEHDSLPGIWNTTYPTITSEQNNASAIGPATFREPIKSLHPLPADTLQYAFVKIRTKDPNQPDWPAEAPSSLAVYTSDAIPGWKNSLLLSTLKTGQLIRLQLSPDGSQVTGDTLTYFKAPIRYRDIALSPDGTRLYLATDSSLVTSGPSGEATKETVCRGCILEFTYQKSASSPTPDRLVPDRRKKRR
ncbi:PQQ-dependent sugar dehydrogenase [Spirosoma sp. KUDC1026]|uniref:PQQ-dependent sugar dehydrogenase n=1 Tax=Spirosoma sp. KUDC1026 TaxID=2745947 RepID=UPI00159BB574|nr:PQQ-dependent sugar dehydrogenase [Spirosoma sp. KUDC1026]QKZ11319.1 PQQ-dependent sugar dehydrogenase [Spirosoma sp. KUDC1026]